jgi:pyruvate dehydrogenase E2 component (dihydrolipoamide acetyltransferase)
MSDKIIPIIMPTWGMSMTVGTLTDWHVEEGETITTGQEIMDVETDKIANAVEATDAGLLRRKIGETGTVYPVKAILGVLAPADVSDEEVDAFIAAYDASTLDDLGDEDAAPAYEFVETPSGRLRYAVRPGDGKPVVFVHGFGGDLDNWLFNIDAAAESGPAYAVDLPGHGQSIKAMANPGLEALTDALEQFIGEMSIDEVDLVGHSMGALVAANLALRGGQGVKSLTLISPAGFGEEINTNYIDGFVSATSRRELKPVLQMLFSDPGLVNRSMIDELLKYRRLDGVQDVLEALSAAMFANGKQSAVIVDQLAKLDLPIQVIWGTKDQVIPVSQANVLPNADVEIIDDAGHMVQMEAASRVNELIKTLMER